ncbi:MAG: helix-turn-helix domain-containing protein [Desulfovibrio sp.]|jgi:transcriptional regulator with XRE-family HTH domain|nr:helix-turn-helix domain-containing protein [Desulfovibrio sp.]
MKEYPYLSQAIGNSIEIFRKNNMMTKSSLAEFAWLERRYLRKIEQGDKRPTVNAVYSICEALNVAPLEFFKKMEEEIERLKAETEKCH